MASEIRPPNERIGLGTRHGEGRKKWQHVSFLCLLDIYQESIELDYL